MARSILLSAAALAVLLTAPVAVQAQSAQDPSTAVNPPAGGANSATSPQNSAPTSATLPPDAAPDASQAGAMPAPQDPSSAEPGASAQPVVVSNGGVPDTAENRAKYGQPLSHAGRATQAAGN